MRDRRKELHSFIHSLNFEDRRHVLDIISSLSDPLFALPVELGLQIFSYLPLLSTWTLRCVSHRWRDVLSSDIFTLAAVLRWQTHNEADSAFSDEQISAASLSSRVEHFKSLYSTQPIDEITFEAGSPALARNPIFAMKGCYIAYVSPESDGRPGRDTIVVRNLINGRQRLLRGYARESISFLCLTTALTAWTTFEGSLYVSYHEKPAGEIVRVQLPSSSIQAVAADGEAIIMLFEPPGITNASEILLYKARSKSLRNYQMLSHSNGFDPLHSANHWVPMLECDRELIHVFAVNASVQQHAHKPDHHVRVVAGITLSFAGERIRTISLPLRVDIPRSVLTSSLFVKYCRPTGRKDEYRLVAFAVRHGGMEAVAQHDLIFDITSGALIAHQSSPWMPRKHLSSIPVPEFIWKQRHHQLAPLAGRDALEYAMNDTFLVALEAYRTTTGARDGLIRVRCFDPNVKMAIHE